MAICACYDWTDSPGSMPRFFYFPLVEAHLLGGLCALQVVYILDQVRALEREMLARIAAQGLEIIPQILVVTRLIPEAEVGRAAWRCA